MVRLLLISGSLRSGSVNTAVLRTALEVRGDVDATLYEGLAELPHFNPDDDPDGGPVPPSVASVRAALRAADGVLICTPEYAGALPGALKNLLEWTVGGGDTYEKPVAWINASARADAAHQSLRTVLGYTGVDLVDEACRRIVVPRSAIGPDGLVADPGLRSQIAGAVDALAARAGESDRSVATISGPGAVLDAVKRAQWAFSAAVRAGDADRLDDLLASDFVIVDGASGGVHDRAAFLETVTNGSARVAPPAAEDAAEPLVRVYGVDTAIVVGHGYTHVFRGLGGRWRLVSAQGTPSGAR